MLQRYIITSDGTMILASDAKVVDLSKDEVTELLDNSSDSERWEYADENGESI